MKPVQLGVIGCGVISGDHLKLAQNCPDAEVVAVADLIEERVTGRGDEFDIVSRYRNAEELLNDDRVEAVILAMPTGDRTPVAFKALECGKHVLLEKPVASNAAEVEKMIEMRGDRVVGCCSSRMTFTGHARAAAECVASGELGRIRMVRIRAIHPADAEPNSNPPTWRESMEQNGGGILVNWSCYDLNYMMHITGWQLEPAAVLANWWPVGGQMTKYAAPGSDADAHYVAHIQCKGNMLLSMERAEFSSASKDLAWEIIGENASLHMPMQTKKDQPAEVMLDRFVPGKGVVSEVIWKEEDGGSEGNVVNDFVQAIRNSSTPRTDLERALVMQKITDGIYGSTESGQSVSVL